MAHAHSLIAAPGPDSGAAPRRTDRRDHACSRPPAAAATPWIVELGTVVEQFHSPPPPRPRCQPQTPDLSAPVGVIAMGHSGLTGEGTGDQPQAKVENSWATGNAPAVNSVYLRLVAARPETEGPRPEHRLGGCAGVAPSGADAVSPQRRAGSRPRHHLDDRRRYSAAMGRTLITSPSSGWPSPLHWTRSAPRRRILGFSSSGSWAGRASTSWRSSSRTTQA